MRDEEGPAVDPGSGVLWIPRFGVTWRQKISALFLKAIQCTSYVDAVLLHAVHLKRTNFDMGGVVPNRALLFRTYPKCQRIFDRLFFFYYYYYCCCFFNGHLQADGQDSIEET